MRRRIIFSLALLFFLFMSGAGLTMLYIMRTTRDLDQLINLHQVEIMRQDLVIDVQKVQTDLYVVGTVFGRELNAIVENVNNLDNSVHKCGTCHHNEEIRHRIAEVESLVARYKESLSRFITASANRARIQQYQIAASNIGNDILNKTQEMTFIAAIKLHERTVDALKGVSRSRIILVTTLLFTFVLALVIAVSLTRGITRPIADLVSAARRLGRGERGALAVYEGADEFGELAEAFNEMSRTIQEKEEKILGFLKQLSGLYEVSLSIHSVMDIGEICRTLSREIGALLDVQQCGLILFDDKRKEYVHRYPALGLTREQSERIVFSAERAKELFDQSTGTTLLSNDALGDARIDVTLWPEETNGTLLLAWIYRKGRILGAIRTAHKRASKFDEEDAKLLSILASHMAVAVENSGLYEDVRTQMRELKDTQEQLVQSAKLAAIGELASNVAHEINNPLTSILGYTELMKDEDELSTLKKDLEIIEKESLRAREIVKQLLEFSRRRPLNMREINVNDVVRDVVPLVVNQAKMSGVAITQELNDVPMTLGDTNQLKQVLVNLMNNAIFAMPEGGKLSISTQHEDQTLLIHVRDTGSGIPDEVLPRIFEPFFSTKKEKGTGLGLSISYSIIQNHGGNLTAKSVQNEGSTFTITLPVKNNSAPA